MRRCRASQRAIPALARSLACVAALAVAGCGAHPKGSRARQATDTQGSAVEVRQSADRPRLSLVERSGDPRAGIAVAIAHDFGSHASAALAELVALRVQHVLPRADATPFDSGLSVRALVASPAEAAAFVVRTHDALRTPPAEAELDAVRSGARAVTLERWASPAAEAVGRCSGELGLPKGTSPSELTQERLAGWLERAYSARRVAFAVTGTRPVLEAAAAALENTGAWPARSPVDDPWPSTDLFDASAGTAGPGRLSVAMRLADAPRTLAAARALARAGSSLDVRVHALEAPWHIDTVVASTRPRGACLRIDLRAGVGSPPSARTASDAAWLVFDEMDHALSTASPSAWSLDDGVLRPSDPRDASSVAAWRALSAELEGAEPRRFASLDAASAADSRIAEAFAEMLRGALRGQPEPTLESRHRVENGQGELWLLAANPCGTRAEGREDAGLLALAVRTLAEAAPRGDVVVEPWLTPDGVGLLVHGPRAAGDESPVAHAERLAEALGRVLLGPGVDGDAIARARATLMHELDADRNALTGAMFAALLPGHPSWLDPRGGYDDLAAHTAAGVTTEIHRLRTMPLRLAVLANGSAEQVEAATAELTRWLRPSRREPVACPPAKAPAARPGRYSVETQSAEGGDTRAQVGVRLASSDPQSLTAAEWTVFLLNRPGGWLERGLRGPGLAGEAHAALLGGTDAAAIVIEITALAERVDEAAAQGRALLSRLATGVVSPEDVGTARLFFSRAHRQASLDPRRRIVDLWRDSRDPPLPTVESLRRFHADTFATDRHVVVIARPKP